MRLLHRKKGFTVVEILIALSIISILSVIGITIFVNVQKNNRDQIRLRDLNTIKQSLELYRNDNRSYPKTLSELSTEYITMMPQDPLSSKPYQIQSSPASCTTTNKDCNSFLLCAKKEGLSFQTLENDCITSGLTCDTVSGDCNMGISSN